MAKIHLIVGFMGFGKTTLAKRLAKELPAVRLTHDEYMVKLFGRRLPEKEFREKYQLVDDMLWHLAAEIVSSGSDVLMDYGFWSREARQSAYNKAQKICNEVIFHELLCEMKTAKQRVLSRSKIDSEALDIDENCFDKLSEQYEPITENENYSVIRYAQNITET